MSTPAERFQKSITKDNLWIYILTLLKDGDLYPCQIREAIKQQFGFSPGNMTAYVVLKKLKSGGYVSIVKRDQKRDQNELFIRLLKRDQLNSIKRKNYM